MRKIIFLLSLISIIVSCQKKTICNDKECTAKKDTIEANSPLICKLTSSEMQERKSTVLTSLQKKILETKELKDGYSFKFRGNDKTINELVDFVKSERACCNFFSFNLLVTGDTSSVWFSLTGPGEAKQFIKTEMEL